MTKDELIEKADDACIFTNDLQVVPLKYALQAIKAEREACAMVCDAHSADYSCVGTVPYEFMEQGARSCAAAIRERSK